MTKTSTPNTGKRTGRQDKRGAKVAGGHRPLAFTLGRLREALADEGVALEHHRLLRVLSKATGHHNAHETQALIAAGALAPVVARPLGSVETRDGATLLVGCDPANPDHVFALPEAAIRGEPCRPSPYGTLVDLSGLLAASEAPRMRDGDDAAARGLRLALAPFVAYARDTGADEAARTAIPEEAWVTLGDALARVGAGTCPRLAEAARPLVECVTIGNRGVEILDGRLGATEWSDLRGAAEAFDRRRGTTHREPTEAEDGWSMTWDRFVVSLEPWDPEDGTDVEVIRFNVDPVDGEEEPFEGASYQTGVPASIGRERRVALMRLIGRTTLERLRVDPEGGSLAKSLGTLSWIDDWTRLGRNEEEADAIARAFAGIGERRRSGRALVVAREDLPEELKWRASLDWAVVIGEGGPDDVDVSSYADRRMARIGAREWNVRHGFD